ncbi:MAG: TetR/AcrR family transcriptional regulator [Actinomycetota bacterium]|nr:TetR/AcrR family transcriptional regulator [Actinomycetota bacterium]
MATDPRVTRTRAHVLAVAGELIAEEGREGFSIDAVARRSGVARTTVYRHWPELGDLILDTFRAMVGASPPPADTGSVRGDLAALYTSLAVGFAESCAGRALPSMLDMTRRDESLQPVHRAFVAERRQPSLDAIGRGVARGELPPGVDAERLVDRLAGPVFYRLLVVQEAYTAGDVERLVDDVLAGRLPTSRRAGRPLLEAGVVQQRAGRAAP